MQVRRIRPGHRIAQILLAAPPVTRFEGDGLDHLTDEELPRLPVPVATIAQMFADDPRLNHQLAKISGYVGDIRKYDDGIVRVQKEGRETVSYQIMNPHVFDPTTGQNIEITKRLTAGKTDEKPAKPVVPVVVNVANNDMVIQESVEGVVLTAAELAEDAAAASNNEAPPAMLEPTVEDVTPEQFDDVLADADATLNALLGDLGEEDSAEELAA